MKKQIIRIAAVLTAVMMAAATPITVYATPEEEAAIQAEIVASESTPYLALGQDLNDAELSVVLNEYGITKEELANYKVAYVTNAMEHQYLDAYIPASVIGTRALSCVMVKEAPKGSGICVTSKNISYCTISMYKNALLTAGVEDADVYVVGPSMISGTAALIGAWMAYENMSGETLSEDRKEAALEEIITIGQLSEGEGEEAAVDSSTGEAVSKEKLEELFSYVKAEVIANGLTDPEKIKAVIEEAQKKYNITLTEDQIKKLMDLMGTIGELDIDPKKLLEQAGDLYDKYGDTVLAKVKDIYSQTVTDDVKKNFWQLVGQFFKNLFGALKGNS